MFDDDDEDETGAFGMVMGFMLFLIVGGLLLGTSMQPPTKSVASFYSQPR